MELLQGGLFHPNQNGTSSEVQLEIHVKMGCHLASWLLHIQLVGVIALHL